ncbi:MAG: hypothetical protein Q8O29_09040 [Polaromonas sp.]|nr:hypothetical protein [Polaromonas sp.]MDP2818406.1 hypothetical protein [Polaromonas sp.]
MNQAIEVYAAAKILASNVKYKVREALNESLRMCGSRIGMGCKADFAANS